MGNGVRRSARDVYTCVYIYIYIYRERERDVYTCVYIYIHIYTYHTHIYETSIACGCTLAGKSVESHRTVLGARPFVPAQCASFM